MDDVEIIDVNEDGEEVPAVVRRVLEHRELENQDLGFLRQADYNPLAGDGGAACSWRPGRRGPSSGG
ncbi:hypothetical protein CRUP_019441 [Coryphaenoides rupestris]|nr:hypothetical protein CRUP_019441 [Coryphaenoides rupestris]